MSDEKPANVIEAIARVMADMKGVGKDQQNRDQGYSFRGIEDVTATLQPVLGKHCVVIVPHEIDHRRESFTVKSGATWTDDFIKISYSIYGPGGATDMIEAGPFLGVGRDNSDKGANKARSMAYKYMLTEVFCIGDKKDDADGETPPAEDPFVTEEMVQRFYLVAAKADLDERDVRALAGWVKGDLSADPASLRMSEWPRLRDEYKRILAAKESASPVTPQGEGAPAPEASTEAPRAVSEGDPPAPTEPEPQPPLAGGRGRARIGSKASEEGS
jgi:hypothetical protein